MKRSTAVRAATWLALLWLSGCAATISPFSQTAYEQAVSLKVEALGLMDQAVHPFPEYQAQVANLRMNLDKAYEYARGRPQNENSSKQWALLRNPEQNLLGGFLKRWESKGTLSPAFIAEAKGIVADGFDMVIELESGKRKADDGK